MALPDPPDPEEVTGTARIEVRRRKQSVAVLRAYRVHVDGTEVGRLKPGGALTVEVDPGLHRVECRLDWYLASLDVVVEPGENAAIECSADPNLLAGGFYLFRRDWLRAEVLTPSTRFTRREPEMVAWPFAAQWLGYAVPVFLAGVLYALIRGKLGAGAVVYAAALGLGVGAAAAYGSHRRARQRHRRRAGEGSSMRRR